MAADAVVAAVDSTPRGITVREASERLSKDGFNTLQEPVPPAVWRVLLRQFKSLLIGLLLFAAGVSALLSDWVDAAVIGAIVLLNACVGAYQEINAEHSISALKKVTQPQTKAWRDGKLLAIPAREIVVGDVVELDAGDIVPADARLLQAESLRCVESSLTGESEPVEKEVETISDPGIPLADQQNMVFMGTTVAGGTGRAVVVTTGMRTEIGKIAQLIKDLPVEPTPLQRKLTEFGRVVIWAALAIVAVLAVAGLLRGHPILVLLMTSISLAVAAVPEGLPAVVTIALALGVIRMAKRRSLVRALPAVETLGSTTVICTDKTGTLTMGEMTVRELYVAGATFDVTGGGYGPTGEVLFEGQASDASHASHLLELATVLAASNNAHLSLEGGRWTVIGDPTEGALLTAASKAGARREHLENLDQHRPRHHEIPFDSDRKRRTIIRIMDGKRLRAYVNGAPELLLDRCSQIYTAHGIRPISTADRQKISEINTAMTSRALRVIGSAYRDIESTSAKHLAALDVENHLVFVGLAGMHDPPRPEAKAAVAECRSAGIHVVMITGDHPSTALAIGRLLGLAGDKTVAVTGAELDHMPDDELQARAPGISIYARVTAHHKLRIVRAWKANGAVVAMTGDGVNDAPALKGADVGIAMGRTGTEVTKQASDLVITDDNFASIVAAVEEGRATYENIRSTLFYLLASNAGELILMAGTVTVGLPLPLLPIHLLWINLVTDGPPALCLAADPARQDLMNRPPLPPSQSVADRRFLMSVAAVGTIVAAIAFAVFLSSLRSEGVEFARARAFAFLVFAQLLLPFSMRRRGGWAGGIQTGLWPLGGVVGALVALQVTVHVTPFLGRLLQTQELSSPNIAALLALAGLTVALINAIGSALRLPRIDTRRNH